MAPTTKPFIRTYDTSKDSNFVFRICQKTAAPGLLKEPAILIAPYIWCVPYPRLCPDHCFVVDDGQGNAVGYIICAPDTREYVQKYKEEYIPVLEDLDPLLKKPQMEPPADWGTDLPTALLQCLYSPDGMLNSKAPNLLKEYPAHLHIDIVPDFQRMGLGTQLMHTLWAKLKDEGVPGVHLVMEGKNYNAEKFYRAIGFERFPEVIDGGKSGETGKEDNGNLWMVKKF